MPSAPQIPTLDTSFSSPWSSHNFEYQSLSPPDPQISAPYSIFIPLSNSYKAHPLLLKTCTPLFLSCRSLPYTPNGGLPHFQTSQSKTPFYTLLASRTHLSHEEPPLQVFPSGLVSHSQYSRDHLPLGLPNPSWPAAGITPVSGSPPRYPTTHPSLSPH